MIMDLNVGLSFFGGLPRQISASPLSEAPIVIRRRRIASSPAIPLPDVSSSMEPNDFSNVSNLSLFPPADITAMSSSSLASASAAVGSVRRGSSTRSSSSSSPLGSSEYSASFPVSSSSSSLSPSSSTSADTSAATSATSSVSSTNSYGSAGSALRDPRIRGATRTVPFMYVWTRDL